jgi:hypothetical protein
MYVRAGGEACDLLPIGASTSDPLQVGLAQRMPRDQGTSLRKIGWSGCLVSIVAGRCWQGR